MLAILLGGVFMTGAVLGRYFRVLVLVPVSLLMTLTIATGSVQLEHSWLRALLEVVATLTCLQLGYAAGLACRPPLGPHDIAESSRHTPELPIEDDGESANEPTWVEGNPARSKRVSR